MGIPRERDQIGTQVCGTSRYLHIAKTINNWIMTPQYMMVVFQGFLWVVGCVDREYHRGTRILRYIPGPHESKQRICHWDAGRALLLFLDEDYGQADS